MSHRSVRRRRKGARDQLRGLFEHPESTWVVHYSCESFYDSPTGGSPRTTSIAVRNIANGQTHSFSVHQVAEELGVAATDVAHRYEEVEKELLTQFFDFVRRRSGHRWLHWNMRDINYGFIALEHRAKVLGIAPEIIEDSRKVDLARVLIDLYSPTYAGHPRLKSILELNRIGMKDFLTGAEEAEAFESGAYSRLHMSTLRKVDVISTLAERTEEGRLDTQAKWWAQHRGSVLAALETLSDSIWVRGAGVVVILYSLVVLIMQGLKSLKEAIAPVMGA